MKIYNKDRIDLCQLPHFIDLLKRLEELKLNNVLIYGKYIINEKYVIVIMKKYEYNLEDVRVKRKCNK